MISNFEFFLPTQIRFGRGVVKEIGEEIKSRGFKKPMLVTDEGIREDWNGRSDKGGISKRRDFSVRCLMV